MKMMGMDCGEVRLPLTALTESQLAELKTTLQRFGLL
jgi:dihydrodipicolinate synthase/N-acetylneuraminate lyase